MKEILIVGGGFAGMWAALAAAHEVAQDKGEVKITLVSRNPYMTIRPRLYEKKPETLRAARVMIRSEWPGSPDAR